MSPPSPQLPPFKIRQLLAPVSDPSSSATASDAHAVIQRLSQRRYDGLLVDQPAAALTYYDDDDGELVQVGSSFELDQRLQEPVSADASLHTFDIEKSEHIIELWKHIEQECRAATVLIKDDTPLADSHENRWASYKSLAASFDQASSAVITQSDAPSNRSYNPLKRLLDAAAVESETVGRIGLPSTSTVPEIPATQAPINLMDDDLLPLDGNAVQPSMQPHVTGATSSNTPAPGQTPGELFAHSLKSLFDGFGLLASIIVDSNGELRQNIGAAQHELQQGVEKAIGASVNAIDGLRAALVPSKDTSRAQSSMLPVPTKPAQKPEAQAAATERVSSDGHVDKQDPPKPFEVERIIARRFITYGHAGGPEYKQYLVRWAGYGPEEDVWYDAENLWGCQRLVEQYERQFVEPLDHEIKLDVQATAAELHCRTAGDRMVTYKRPSIAAASDITEQMSNLDKTSSNDAAPSSVGSHKTPLVKWLESSNKQIATEPARSDPIDIPANKLPMRSKSLRFETLPSSSSKGQEAPASASISPERKLRHRQSWHPLSGSSGKLGAPFVFSPSSVLARYPPVAQIEQRAAAREGKRREAVVPDVAAAAELNVVPGHRPEVFERNRELVRQLRNGRADPASRPLSQNIEMSSLRNGHGPPKDHHLRRAKSLAFHTQPGPQPALISQPAVSSERAQPTLFSNFEHGQLRRVASERRVEPNARAKDDPKLSECVQRLREMGFSKWEAEAAATATAGDLTSAIDTLEEDRNAWRIAKDRHGKNDRTANPAMPGAWNGW